MHTTHRTFLFYTFHSSGFRYIARNTPKTCYRSVKTAPDTKLLLWRILTTADNSQVVTSLCKHCPLSKKCPQKQRNKYFNAYLYLTSIRRKTQNYKMTLLFTVTFFVTSTTSNTEVKQTFTTLAFADLLCTISAHILYVMNVIILQNKSTAFSSTRPFRDDSQFRDASLNLSGYVIAIDGKVTLKTL